MESTRARKRAACAAREKRRLRGPGASDVTGVGGSGREGRKSVGFDQKSPRAPHILYPPSRTRALILAFVSVVPLPSASSSSSSAAAAAA
jgi:hypothetical protein